MNPIWAVAAAVAGSAIGAVAAWDVRRRLSLDLPWWQLVWVPAAAGGSAAAMAISHPDWWGLPVTLVMIVGGWWIAAIDAYSGRIPDWTLIPVAIAVAAVASIAAASTGMSQQLLLGLGGAGLSALIMWIVHLVTRGGVGFGDVKLAGLTGGVAGLWSPLLSVWHLALAIAGMAAILVVSRRKQAPFAPLLVAACVIVITVAR